MIERGFPLKLSEPVSIEQIKLEKRSSNIDKHFHTYYEIYFLVDGQVDYFIDNRAYPVSPFNVIFLSPHTLHKSLISEGSHYERILVYFNGEVVENKNILSRFDENNKVMSLSASASKSVYKILCMMLQESNNTDDLHHTYTQSLLNELIITILRNVRDVKAKHTNKNFKEIIDYVKENFKEKLSLVNVADKFYLNPSYLSKIFKENTGFTFTSYLNYQRIIYAQQLLSNTTEPVTSIAAESGFDSNTHFGRVFKQLIGVSPRSYRNHLVK